MAILRRASDDKEFALPAQCVIGRSTASHICIDDEYASSEHAKLTWTGDRWMIRDLGSRNGTFVNGDRVPAGKPRVIEEGAEIGFGDKKGWSLPDTSPPFAAAINLESREVQTSSSEILTLPDPDAPAVSIYPGTSESWLAEWADGRSETVADQQQLEVDGATFLLCLPNPLDQTPLVDETHRIETIELVLGADHVQYIARGVEHEVGALKHWRVIRHLASARLEDADKGIDAPGWRTLEAVAEAEGLAVRGVYTAIHRAREQLSRAGVQGAAQLIEVRKGERRLGIARVRVQ